MKNELDYSVYIERYLDEKCPRKKSYGLPGTERKSCSEKGAVFEGEVK